MYLSMLALPILGSTASGFVGRQIGVTGSQLITCTSVAITTALAGLAFVEVTQSNTPVGIDVCR